MRRPSPSASAGAEVVKADMHNTDEVKSALDGAYGAFVVTQVRHRQRHVAIATRFHFRSPSLCWRHAGSGTPTRPAVVTEML